MSLRDEAHAEGLRLLDWWEGHLVDGRGGFYGEVDAGDRPVLEASKSIILNTRLLWFFSAMSGWSGDARALTLARRAADYIRTHFHDAEQGGLYWRLTAAGLPEDTRKQAYAQGFAVYAFAEYHQATGDAGALTFARDLQNLIEAKYWDAGAGGYIEALSADWRALPDQRLSDKDLNAPKTMNTHLHVLEAYSRLHGVAPAEDTRAALHRIFTLFLDRFVAPEGHLRLFFGMDWNDLTRSVSYGHDIEASWLIWEAAEALGDETLLARARPVVLALAETTRCEGLRADGALAYEKGHGGHLDPDGEWWEQAEALVGFVNAWQMTGEAGWLGTAERVWNYTKAQYGAGGATEWTWYAALAPREKIYKAGQWKCPYHNGRAMIELDRRLR
ncbi:AGE family epimerase/isomerase [Asticcacaulis sp.]|uniref:AGE family epimerase/isomerase n=1 Tax=Asticcacaulis sp. TaxID=1872648 RepID=UPI002C2A735D|nr:AGE family epimerase/isomerase [Asticcacaulis sp.]HTM81178.1 AGE family epimerase/isomerase [Asticcacaulis sp.]